MKKLRLLVFASLVATGASAQYFQHVYGGPTRDYLESGVNINLMFVPQGGHVMTGYTDRPVQPIPPATTNCMILTRTDNNGRIPGFPFFNERHPIVENNMQVDAKARRVIHANNLNGNFSVWGDYGNQAFGLSTKFFYALMPLNGGNGPIFSYQLPYPVVEAEATSMTESTSMPGNVFVCGFVRVQAGGPRQPIAMCLNGTTGAIVWSWLYVGANSIDWTAMDLVESPYPGAMGPEVALVGHYTRPGFPERGCFWRVLACCGNTIGLIEYGAPGQGTPCGLNAIDIAANPFGTGPGFVLGGYLRNPATGNDDAWALKVNPTGNVVNFSTLVDYIPNGNNNYGNDIIERRNTFLPPNNYEYYLGGYVTPNGIMGGEDAVVDKLNFAGGCVPFGQFSYGGQGNERAMQLDQLNGFGINNDGLSTFGTTVGSFPLLGAQDFYFVKSYFNGVVRQQCYYNLLDDPCMSGPGVRDSSEIRTSDKFKRGNLSMSLTPMQDFEICWTPMDPAGSNARHAAPEQEIMQPGYFPNPVSRDNAIVTVTFGQEVTDGEAEVELWNSLGQLCWTKKVPLTEGQTEMKVELGNGLSGGMYHLIVRQNGALNNYRILVQ